MQAKPLMLNLFFLLKKSCFDSENLFPIGLKPCSDFCKISESESNRFGALLQNL
jgi:hypothetical protein